MAAGSPYDRVTENHDEIKRWARQRGGKPVETPGTAGPDVGIRFPGGDAAGSIGWSAFFDRFESAGLAFAYATDAGTTGVECAVIAGDPPAPDAELVGEAPGAETHDEARLDEQRAEARAREAADEANQDGHRDEPPFNS